MATSVIDDHNVDLECDLLNCPICLERFKNPKYLPCLHTFCESCLDSYIISTQSENDSPNSFYCPVCRHVVQSPDDNSKKENWAKLFPLNHMIFSLMTKSDIGKGNDETICEICEKRHETSKALFWCFECAESFCENCSAYHNLFKAFLSHKVKPIQELDPQEYKLKIPDIEEPCIDHKREMLKVYCLDHEKMCCIICLSVNHRKCENIKTFEEMAETLKDGDGQLELYENLTEIYEKVENLKVAKQQNFEKLNAQQRKVMDDTSDLIKVAKQKLDRCHEDFKIQFSQTHKEMSTKILDTKESLENFQKTVSNGQKMLKAVLQNGSPKQLFVVSKKIKDQLQVQGDELQKLLKDDKAIEYEATMNKQLESLATSVSSVADVKLKFRDIDESDTSILSCFERRDNVPKDDDREVAVENLEAVKIWDLKEDGWITGGLFLSDGSLLCSNFGSKTLSIYDDEGHLQVSHNLTYHPWDVVQCSDDAIAVTGYTSKVVKIYTLLQNIFTEIRSIRVPFTAMAVSVLKDHILVQGDGYVHVLTNKGDVVRKVKASDYSYIATKSLDNDPEFYYCENHDVICQSLDGRELLRHKIPNLKSEKGVGLDSSDNIFVCCQSSRNIYVMSKDGRLSRAILSNLEPVGVPFALGFNKNYSQFFVSGYNNGCVSVYKLCS